MSAKTSTTTSTTKDKYVNHGLKNWKEIRKEWRSSSSSSSSSSNESNNTKEEVSPPPINIELILDNIYPPQKPSNDIQYRNNINPNGYLDGGDGKGVSLPALVLILNDLWEVEKD